MKTLSRVLIDSYDGQWDTFPSPTDTLEDYDNIIWKTDSPPTLKKLRALGVFPTLVDRKAAYDAQAYARKRAEEYPTIQELVVALYDTDDKSAIEAKRAAVKAKYPKG